MKSTLIRTLVLGGLMASLSAFGQTGNSPGSRTTPSSGLPNTGTPGSASATNNYNYRGADPEALFAALDTNKDGRLSKKEFLKIATGTDAKTTGNLSTTAPRTEIRPAEPAPVAEKEFNPRVGTGASGSSTTTGRTESSEAGTAKPKEKATTKP